MLFYISVEMRFAMADAQISARTLSGLESALTGAAGANAPGIWEQDTSGCLKRHGLGLRNGTGMAVPTPRP